MILDLVPRRDRQGKRFRVILGVTSENKEGRLDRIAFQKRKDPLCSAGMGSVVKGQGDPRGIVLLRPDGKPAQNRQQQSKTQSDRQ